MKKSIRILSCALLLIVLAVPSFAAQRTLRVALIPADGGTEDGTLADWRPLFAALSKMTGLEFDLKVGQSYAMAIQAMVNKHVDLAWFGPVSYLQTKKRGAAELLAISVKKGNSVYYSGIFVARDSDMKNISDLKGKKVAFGDTSSTSSFVYPMAKLIESGIDPIKDLDRVYLTGSHSNSLQALANGHVDAAAASFISFDKAVNAGAIDFRKFRLLVKSVPIPNPPLAMHPNLPESLKQRLRKAIAKVHKAPGITPDMIRGYGGRKVDRYDSDVDESLMDEASKTLELLTPDIMSAILEKAGER